MRPFVTLTYAQSLDGCIALRGQRTALSGPESLKMTHQLRADHDAILIGIGTVLIDNPSLTVRLVEGSHPQPIVLDSHLRIPLTASLLNQTNRPLWLAVTEPEPSRVVEMETAGVRVIRLPADSAGRVSLPDLLDRLGQLGIKRLMVEGGAQVIQSFLEQRFANKLIVTIAPRLLGGLNAIQSLTQPLDLRHANYRQLGADLILEADLA